MSGYFQSLPKMLFNDGRAVPYGMGLSRAKQVHHIPFGSLADEHQVPGRPAVTVITKYLQVHLGAVLSPDRRYLTPSRKDGTCRVREHHKE